MPTNDERRRVAAALRKVRVYTLQGRGDDGSVTEWSVALMSDLAAAVGLEEFRGIDVYERLADLIELKGIESEAFYPVESDGFDRGALLAVADEMERWARDGGDGFEPVLSRAGCAAYARRIREACEERNRKRGRYE